MANQFRMVGGRPLKAYRLRNYIGEDYITVVDVTPAQLQAMGAPDQSNTYLNCQGKIYRWFGGTWIDFFPNNGGPRGGDGASAYQLATADGFQGSQAEWLASLKVKGDPGPPASLSIGGVSTSTSGNATATITGTPPNQVLSLTVPQGNKGDPGPAAALAIGTVRTLASGQPAAASVSGAPPNQVLNLDLPMGSQGPRGQDGISIKGDPGAPASLKVGTVTTLDPGANATVTITGTAPNQTVDFGIPMGAQGPMGALTIGAVTTLPANASAIATIVNNQLNLALPAGPKGDPGGGNAPTPASYSHLTPVLNAAAQLSINRDAQVSYNVDVAITSLLATTTGAVFLEYADNSAMTTNVVTVASGVNTVGGVLNVTNTATVALTGRIPAGKYRRIRTQVVSGSPTFTARHGQEILL